MLTLAGASLEDRLRGACCVVLYCDSLVAADEEMEVTARGAVLDSVRWYSVLRVEL